MPAPTTPPGWPGNDKLPQLARATYEAAQAAGFGGEYPARAAAGAVLPALGLTPRDPVALAERARWPLDEARALGRDPFAAFVRALTEVAP